MNILVELRNRFATALATLTADCENYSRLVLPAQNSQFGDYQANCAMPLAKQLGKPPREIAQQIINNLKIDDLCEAPEIAGPGFINLKLKTDYLQTLLNRATRDQRLGTCPVTVPQKIVIDYSSPNVAKPMHVGHLRSSVIGDALYHILKFLGHDVVSDNHIGDWGTQFGMILYGYKNFLDQAAYEQNQVAELSRLYRLVNQLCEYHQTVDSLPGLKARQAELEQAVNDAEAQLEQNDNEKESKRVFKKLQSDLGTLRESIRSAEKKIAQIEEQAELKKLAEAHPKIVVDSRLETAKLHAGDAENRQLWEQFLPACNAAMQEVYDRLQVRFDLTLGESYYQPMLAGVVESLKTKQLAEESQGAVCVFVPGIRAPFIVQKQDGAFTYATTDLATIQYRAENMGADVLLYVVDKRQSEHFQLLFETAKLWGFDKLNYQHVSFGTVMGKDNKPYKTRSGDIVGLSSLLDEAVLRAKTIVETNDNSKPNGPELSEEERQQIAEIIGLGSIKYADLHHNRDSDYVFDWDKMISMTGDTAAYMQYAFARICGIFRKAGVSRDEMLLDNSSPIVLEHPAERALGLQLARFEDALANVSQEYRPNLLTNYLFETANSFSTFYDQCQVASEENPQTRHSRFRLSALTAATIQLGLKLLGIQTSERM